jgi:hypothetical protein
VWRVYKRGDRHGRNCRSISCGLISDLDVHWDYAASSAKMVQDRAVGSGETMKQQTLAGFERYGGRRDVRSFSRTCMVVRAIGLPQLRSAPGRGDRNEILTDTEATCRMRQNPAGAIHKWSAVKPQQEITGLRYLAEK